MANKIPDAGVILPWDQDAAEDIEVGLGINWATGKAVIVFDRFTRTMSFDEHQLKQFINALEAQRALLLLGRPAAH